MTGRRHFGERWLRAAFRWHPVRFRQAYADEMLDYYRETCARHALRRGRLWQLRFLARSITAAAREGLRQRRLDSRPKERVMTGFSTDVRHAVRRIRARPLGSALAAGMLALAIGIATAMFTLVDALLLTPAPFPDPSSLAKIAMRTDHTIFGAVSPAILRAWRESGIFSAVEGTHTVSSVIETGDLMFGREAAFVTPGALRQLGARPIAGRIFDAAEGRTGVQDAVIVSERLWRTVLGGDRTIVGTRIRVDKQALMVIGVLPDAFRFPKWDTELWRPIDYDALPATLASSRAQAIVRFGPAVPEAAALERASAIAVALEPNIGRGDSNARAARFPLSGVNSQGYLGQATPFLAASVGLVFLVLCANVCSLLLAQLGTRAREFGMCTALGASRRRLLRQAFTESALLGAAALVFGVGVAWLLVAMARAWLPDSFLMQTLNPIDLDPRALLAASALGLAATLVAGLVPARIGTRVGTGAASSQLRAESRGATESKLARRVTRGLLVGEIALSCTLLLGTALLVLSFVRLAGVERGLDAHGVITAWLDTRAVPAGTPPAATPAAAIDEAARHIPGVTKVTVSQSVPPSGAAIHFGAMWTSDAPATTALDLGAVSDYSVTSDFFEMFHIRVLRGRTFEAGDDARQVVVSEQFASRMWPGAGGDVTGRSFTLQKEPYVAIGVVNEIRYPSLERPDGPEIYRQEVAAGGQLQVSLRCAQACPSLPMVRQKLVALPDVRRVFTLANLEDTYLGELARPKAAAAIATVFGAIGLIAAAGGLFSVLSYAVARRRREFGIRLSLGAPPAHVHRMVFREGAQLAAAGAAIGGLTAWGLARFMNSVVYDATVSDPAIWLSVLGLVSVTTIAAVWLPSRRAASVDPVELLREV